MIRELLFWLAFGPGLHILAGLLIGIPATVGIAMWIIQGDAYTEVREQMHPEREWGPVPAPRLWEVPVYEPPRGED